MEIRYLSNSIEKDALAEKKMAFLSGPRQVGKTTLAKGLLESTENYYTWDASAFRRAWTKDSIHAVSGRGNGLVVLDEIHKDKKWKTRLKGLFDTQGDRVPILVTGSGKLEMYRKGSDSLMGRYFPYRMLPFTVGESPQSPLPDQVLEFKKPHYHWKDLLQLGGFPEPFFGASEQKAIRWSRLRLDRLIEEDVRDFKNISSSFSMRLLCELLPEKVGGLFSVLSLREDLDLAYATVRSWVQLLESLYFCFRIKPYSKKIIRSLKAEPKLFLFDLLRIPKERESARLENLAALHLLKACFYWTDVALGEFELFFVRDRQKREVDFLLVRDHKPWMLVECKSNSKHPSEHLLYFKKLLNVPHAIQLVSSPTEYDRWFAESQVRVVHYEKFFSNWV